MRDFKKIVFGDRGEAFFIAIVLSGGSLERPLDFCNLTLGFFTGFVGEGSARFLNPFLSNQLKISRGCTLRLYASTIAFAQALMVWTGRLSVMASR
ncbi:hypothetical protein X744_21105 [Mesorhizobium sp. LNJC372A00]|nr:hypothetical protein X745_23880 [Mesorhizobium sp. LNJC374B00]ESY56844.1 hypothetical protein X744_21105 [Mesorhizobium sp. LNJC372A00]